MKNIKLYTSVSLDGYLAPVYGGFDLLQSVPVIKNEDYGKKSFYNSIDAILMGGNTYDELFCMNAGAMPFDEKEIYVVSKNALETKSCEKIHFIRENFIAEIKKLKEQSGKDIWLLGGGVLISSLLKENLIDTMILNYMPVMLGNGIPLFPKFSGESKWKLINNCSFENNILQIEYQLIK